MESVISPGESLIFPQNIKINPKETMKQTLMKTTAALIFFVAVCSITHAQPITLSGTNYSQNFDGLISGPPGEWLLYTVANSTSLGTLGVMAQTDPSTNKAAWADTSGGYKNYASTYSYAGATNFLGTDPIGIQSNSVNRALGVRPVSATDAGNAFVLKVVNTTGFGKFKLDVDMLLLNPQTRSNYWNCDFGVSPDGFSPPTSFTSVSNHFYYAFGNFGATHETIDFGTLLDNQPGPVFIRIWNEASQGTSSRPTVGIDNFSLSFTNVPVTVVKPTITTSPQSTTAYVGDTFSFKVANNGTAPFIYQWYKNDFNTPVGDGTSTLQFPQITTGDAGTYYVIVSNDAGSATNNPPAVLTVGTRIPIVTTIAALRTNQIDAIWSPGDTTNLYTVTGVVINRVNMTTPSNASFFIEDTNTGCGIDVFIGGDTSTRPAYGDIMQVTGPLGQYNGLLEINMSASNPTHLVNNLGASGYNVSPKPFNFTSVSDFSLMETNVESSLVVVSNVYIQYGGTGTNYPNGSTLNLTNLANQVFTLFIDSRLTDIIGQPIPGGLVNITGYMSQFDSSSPYTSGYQLVPTYAGSIVPAPVVATPIPLNYTYNGSNLTLSWTDSSFTLQSSTNVAGPYVNVSGATSPFATNTSTSTQPAVFFRLYHP